MTKPQFLLTATVFHFLACLVASIEVAQVRKLRALGSSYRFGGDNGRDHGVRFNSTGDATTSSSLLDEDEFEGSAAAKVAIKAGVAAVLLSLIAAVACCACKGRANKNRTAVVTGKEDDATTEAEESTTAADNMTTLSDVPSDA